VTFGELLAVRRADNWHTAVYPPHTHPTHAPTHPRVPSPAPSAGAGRGAEAGPRGGRARLSGSQGARPGFLPWGSPGYLQGTRGERAWVTVPPHLSFGYKSRFLAVLPDCNVKLVHVTENVQLRYYRY